MLRLGQDPGTGYGSWGLPRGQRGGRAGLSGPVAVRWSPLGMQDKKRCSQLPRAPMLGQEVHALDSQGRRRALALLGFLVPTGF